MKKILLFFTLLAVSLSAVANDLTFVFSEHGYTNGQDFDGETIDLGSGISLALSKGEGGTTPKYYDTSTAIRLYRQNTATFSIASGEITKIECTWTQGGNYISADEGTYDGQTGTWTGSASSVTLKYYYTAGHARLQKVVITYTGNENTLPVTTLNTFGYATFSADMDLKVKTEGVTAYKAAVYGDEIILTQLDAEKYIPMGTGVILKGNDDTQVEFEASDIPVGADDLADMTDNDLKATTLADGSLATLEPNSWALKGEEFLQFTGEGYTENRAYLVHEPISDQANSLHIVFADAEQGSETSIETVSAGTQTLTFDLNGRRATAKGLLIKNGKAVFVK